MAQRRRFSAMDVVKVVAQRRDYKSHCVNVQDTLMYIQYYS